MPFGQCHPIKAPHDLSPPGGVAMMDLAWQIASMGSQFRISEKQIEVTLLTVFVKDLLKAFVMDHSVVTVLTKGMILVIIA